MKHSTVVLLTGLAGLYALPALGATVSGTAAIGGYYGNGTPASISLSSNVDPVALNRIETVNGLGTGSVLGLVRVNGDTSGAFDLLAFVQRAGTAQSSFHFFDTFTNTAGVAQSFQMAFVIAPGKLQTQIFEPFDPADDRYRASYDLTISLDGVAAFSSSASLYQGGAFTQTGTDLGGTLTHDGFAPDRWAYAWQSFNGLLDLGVLAPGESVSISYDATAFARFAGDSTGCGGNCGSATAQFGDPFSIDGSNLIGNPDQIGPVHPVPLPAALWLFGTAAGALGSGLRRAVRDRGRE